MGYRYFMNLAVKRAEEQELLPTAQSSRAFRKIARFAPAAAGPIRRFGACSCLSRHLGLVCHLSWAELQATPVAGGEVFRRRTRTLTFIDWVPAPLNVPRTGAASLASRPKETAICCSPHQQLLVGSKATQV